MWSYYGSKTNLAKLYPPPRHSKIIEPFAGSARYALRYFEKDVLLIDKYEVIVKIWKWLQQCSPDDLMRMPMNAKPGQRLDDFTFECEEARLLFGFLIAKGAERPRYVAADRVTIMRPNAIKFSLHRIAQSLFKIRHWEIRHDDFQNVENQTATWFIDPPYQHGGHSYVKSNRHINFPGLGEWCKSRDGQVIVCENTKADWLDFKPLQKIQGSAGSSVEAIWTNQRSSYNAPPAIELFNSLNH